MNPKTRMDLRSIRSPAIDAVHAALAAEPARVMGLDWTMTPGFQAVFDLETISGPDVTLNGPMMYLAQALGIQRTYTWRLFAMSSDYGKVSRCLDFLNVRYLLNDPAKPKPAGTRQLGSYDLNLYESDTAWPRAFFTDTVGTYRDMDDMAEQVQKGDGRPFATVLPAVRQALPLPAKDPAQRVVEKGRNYHLTTNTTSFEIDAPSAGMVVLSEADSTGDILAYVDGHRVPCLRANLVFRGVYLDKPGHHVVKFAYWPRLLGPALWVAAVGLAGLLGSVLLWFRGGLVSNGTLPAKS
jgi:hypothetical protein